MTTRAGGRLALIAATGLLVCLAGVSWTVAAGAAETKSENVSTTKKVKQVRYYKRSAHRKHARSVQKSSEAKKPAETTRVAEAGLPGEIPAAVAEANARMGGEIADDNARAMTARANALLASDRPAEGQGAVTMQMAQADQLNEADKALEPTPPSQTTVAVAPAKPAIQAKPAVVQETSTWDQTSLIGKIFIAFGALLTIASAARMFMA